MKLDVLAITEFFTNYTTAQTMPRVVLDLTNRGDVVASGDMRTLVSELKGLDLEVQRLFEAQYPRISPARNIPLLYLGEGRYIACDHNSGKRIGAPDKVYGPIRGF